MKFIFEYQTLVFRPKAGAKAGAIVRKQFTSGWDDKVHAGMTSSSNSVMVTLIAAGNNRDDTKGAVIWFPQHGQSVERNKSLILTANFYSPDEAVDFWYTDADNNSVQLGMFWADPNGKLTLEFSATGLTEGKTYTIVGKGRRSGIIGSAALTVIAAKSNNNNSSQKPATAHK